MKISDAFCLTFTVLAGVNYHSQCAALNLNRRIDLNDDQWSLNGWAFVCTVEYFRGLLLDVLVRLTSKQQHL